MSIIGFRPFGYARSIRMVTIVEKSVNFFFFFSVHENINLLIKKLSKNFKKKKLLIKIDS